MHQSISHTPELRLAEWARHVDRSVLRQMIAIASKPGILSFAGGLPDPELFPVKGYADALNQVLLSHANALQYCPPYQPLKEGIVELMAARGVSCCVEQVFLTSGAQQGLDVLTRLLLDKGGDVILEEIIYTGAQQAVFARRPRILAVPTDMHTGMNVDAVESYLYGGSRPAYIYVIPQAHNPLGVTLGYEKRLQLTHLAIEYGVPIIEDDPYGFLEYSGQQLPPLRSLSDDWVFYLGSFSKILAPALRLGWIIVPESLVAKLTVVKEACDLESSALTQRAVATYLASGEFPGHLDKLRKAYGRRRDAMLDALDCYFPDVASWTLPTGGMFIWVELPEGFDTVRLLDRAIDQEQIAFIPGQAFALPHLTAAQHRASRSLRLSFSNCSTLQITDGIRRLAMVIERY